MVYAMLQILDGYSSKWVLMNRHSKFKFFSSDFEFWIFYSPYCCYPLITLQGVNQSLHSHQRETIYDKLIFFCKIVKAMKVKRVSKIWVKMSIINIHLLNSKFEVICKNEDFECRYIRTHTKEKPSKISNITFAILLFSHQNTLTKLPSCVLWSLLLLMKPSYAL